MMENFEYKNYSLKNISTWIQDAISAEVEPEEIYKTIKEAVQEEYNIFKNYTNRCHELLSLLNGEKNIENNPQYSKPLVCNKDDNSSECKTAWNSFWEELYYPEEVKNDDCMPPWGHSDMEALKYTDEELDAMCNKAVSDNNLKEEISRNDVNRVDYKDGLIYESPDGGKTVYSRKPGQLERTLIKEEPTNKWTLQIECDSANNELFLTLPEDLLLALDWKEGDELEWVESKNNTYSIHKVTKLIKMEEC